MEPAVLGIVLDSSVLIAAERRGWTAAQTISHLLISIGEIPLVLSAVTVAELGHGIYRANTPEIGLRRRQFLDDLKATIPIHPLTAATAEIVARAGGEQAAKGINLPLGDLLIGACALELGYAVGTGNVRDFNRIPGLRIVSL
jgi:predicted nucleic acid-binding protein